MAQKDRTGSLKKLLTHIPLFQNLRARSVHALVEGLPFEACMYKYPTAAILHVAPEAFLQ